MTESLSKIQAVILAGGLGTRLRPLTEKCPKPLVEVGGKPYLSWQLKYLKKQGFKKILILTGYLGEMVEAEFGDGGDLGLQISYSHEPEPLGTGGALLLAYDQLEEEFILLFGDSFLPLDYGDFLSRFHTPIQGEDLVALMAVYDNKDDTTVPENVSLDKNGIVVRYEKGAGRKNGCEYVEAGVYAVHKEIFNGWSPGVCSFEADISKKAREQGRVGGYISSERFYDIGTPERLKLFEKVVVKI